jgi:hypothetical protein
VTQVLDLQPVDQVVGPPARHRSWVSVVGQLKKRKHKNPLKTKFPKAVPN